MRPVMSIYKSEEHNRKREFIMRYINTLCEGETIRNVYLCKGKRSAETRNGKPYDNLILQDKTGNAGRKGVGSEFKWDCRL